MNSLGLPIVGDDFYPRIQTRPYDDFSQPLQLVARMLRFTDPITGEKREFVSRVPLKQPHRDACSAIRPISPAMQDG